MDLSVKGVVAETDSDCAPLASPAILVSFRVGEISRVIFLVMF